MTTFTATQSVTPVRRSGRARAARIGLWTIRIVLAAQFATGGMLKLSADPQMVAMFELIGDGQGLRLLVGLCEVAGALGLLVPRLARLAGIGLVALMTGAAVTNIVALQASPVLPLVLLTLAAVVVVATRRTRSAR